MPDTRYPAHLQDAKHERVKLQGVALYHDSFVNLRIGPDRHRTHTLASTHAPWACLPPQDPKRERVKLLGRRGFARIALEEQVDGIVCVYYFGQSQVRERQIRYCLRTPGAVSLMRTDTSSCAASTLVFVQPSLRLWLVAQTCKNLAKRGTR